MNELHRFYSVIMVLISMALYHCEIRTCDFGDTLSQRSAIANGRYCHVMYKLLYPSIRVRTAPPVSVRVRVRVSVSFSVRIFAIADLNRDFSIASPIESQNTSFFQQCMVWYFY